MMRSLMSVSVAAVGLALLAAPPTRAEGRSGGRSGRSSNGPSHVGPTGGQRHRGSDYFDYRFDHRSRHDFNYRFDHRPRHDFRANRRFDYGKHGFRSLYWTRYCWSRDYRCYLYWAPWYRCWCFYEPSYSCYVPVSYYGEVYPETSPTVAATGTPAPSVVQQTTVVATPPASVADAVPPAPLPPVAPTPTAVQKTKVGPGAP